MYSPWKVVYTTLALPQFILAMEASFHGRVFPPPRSVSQDADFQASMTSMASALEELMETTKEPGDNSIAIMGRSASEATTAFEFYHTGTQVDGATPKVGPESIFRIGSVSKLFTVYTLLVQLGYDVFSAPVPKYVPELRHSRDADFQHIDWDEISVGALASHMAGVPRDYNHADIAAQALPFEQLGLPDLAEGEIPTCDGNFTQPLCSRKEFLQGIRDRDRVFPPWASPAYSNAAFKILGYVGEKIGKKPFDEVLQNEVLGPLGLRNTHSRKPNDRRGVIPSDQSLWSLAMGDDFPSGGIYSSVRDLCTFGSAILNNSQLLPTTTSRWMKPTAFTQSLTSAVGMPWEIYKQDVEGHVIDFYTKGGSIGQYGSLLVLIPEYDFVFAVLAAGSNVSLSLAAADTVRNLLVPALGAVSRTQAATQYAGHYVSTQGNNSISITSDEGSGLLIDGWFSNGVDFMQAMAEYAKQTGSGELEAVRLYPADMGPKGQAFRLVFITQGNSEQKNGELFAHGMKAWTSVDQLVYGQQPMDELVLSIGQDQEVTGVRSIGLRVDFEKVDA